jgi:uncharacterized protein
MKVSCPTCKKQQVYSQSNPNRPFCSERCKLIDLGEWASEGHKIEGKSAKEALFSEELQRLIESE